MERFDLQAFLADVAKPLTVKELVDRGDLIDCTVQAAWVGFSAPAYMTSAAWDSVIAPRRRRTLLAIDTRAMGVRQRNMWQLLYRAYAEHNRNTVPMPKSIRVKVPLVEASSYARLEMAPRRERGTVYILVKLSGE